MAATERSMFGGAVLMSCRGGMVSARLLKALKTEEEGTTSKRPLSRSARCDSEHLAPAAPLHPATGR
jgi:hypothetical protein